MKKRTRERPTVHEVRQLRADCAAYEASRLELLDRITRQRQAHEDILGQAQGLISELREDLRRRQEQVMALQTANNELREELRMVQQSRNKAERDLRAERKLATGNDMRVQALVDLITRASVPAFDFRSGAA